MSEDTQEPQGSYTVFYARHFTIGSLSAMKAESITPLVSPLRVAKDNYVQVAQVKVAQCVPAEDIERIFYEMQGDFMPTCQPEIYKHIQKLTYERDTDHTSMSVGDVLLCPDGKTLICMMCGWQEIRFEDDSDTLSTHKESTP